MKFSKLFSALVLTSVVSGAIAQSASAIEVYKDTSGNVYATGATPSLATEFVFTGVTQTKSVVSNSCGAISLKGSSTSPLPSTVTIFGNDYNVSAFSTALKPTCTAGVWNVAPTGSFKTSAGEVVIIGLTPNTAIPINFSGSVVKRPTANLCGIAKISNGGSFTPSGAFTITGQTGSFDVATLTVKANPDICRNGVTYRAL